MVLLIFPQRELKSWLDMKFKFQYGSTNIKAEFDRENEDDIHLNSIKFSLKKHYEYLNKDVINYSLKDDRVIVNVLVDEDETLVLNNIEFFENGDKLEMKINSNTRSSDVVTLSVGDKYTEGELITRMKNNGYVCK